MPSSRLNMLPVNGTVAPLMGRTSSMPFPGWTSYAWICRTAASPRRRRYRRPLDCVKSTETAVIAAAYSEHNVGHGNNAVTAGHALEGPDTGPSVHRSGPVLDA